MTVCHTYQALAQIKTWLLMCLELLSHVPVTPRKQESIGGNGQLQAIIQGDLMFYFSQESTQAPRLPHVSLFRMFFSSIRITFNFRVHR